jgi:CheY-like chemotaxis protein
MMARQPGNPLIFHCRRKSLSIECLGIPGLLARWKLKVCSNENDRSSRERQTMKKSIHVTCTINLALDKIEIRPAPMSAPIPRPRILVVEDDAYVREMYFDVLASAGYHVDSAKDGEAGWQMLCANRSTPKYHLLITDNKMPKVSGLELIQRLQSENLDIPVILASGNLPGDTRDLPVAAILAKPFLPDQLMKMVAGVLNAHENA